MTQLTDDEHVRFIGALVVDIQSLEFILRSFLFTIYDANDKGLNPNMPSDLHGLEVGQVVPLNYFTNYDSLGDLINKYNDYLITKDESLTIDKKRVVDLRDALAHGRVFQDEKHTVYQLLKFDKPIGKHVRVCFSETMDKQWFKDQTKFVRDECYKVYNAAKKYAPTMIV